MSLTKAEQEKLDKELLFAWLVGPLTGMFVAAALVVAFTPQITGAAMAAVLALGIIIGTLNIIAVRLKWILEKL